VRHNLIVVEGKIYISAIVYILIDKSLNTNCGCDIIKIIIFFLIFLIGLASAYTSEQQTALNETALNETALNETALNETALNETALNETALNETALNETALNETTPKELTIIPVSTKLKNPFNAGSDLSKFGKQQVYDL